MVTPMYMKLIDEAATKVLEGGSKLSLGGTVYARVKNNCLFFVLKKAEPAFGKTAYTDEEQQQLDKLNADMEEFQSQMVKYNAVISEAGWWPRFTLRDDVKFAMRIVNLCRIGIEKCREDIDQFIDEHPINTEHVPIGWQDKFYYIATWNVWDPVKWCYSTNGDPLSDWKECPVIDEVQYSDDEPVWLTALILEDEELMQEFLEDDQKNHPERAKVKLHFDLRSRGWKIENGTLEMLA